MSRFLTRQRLASGKNKKLSYTIKIIYFFDEQNQFERFQKSAFQLSLTLRPDFLWKRSFPKPFKMRCDCEFPIVIKLKHIYNLFNQMVDYKILPIYN